MVGWMKGKLTMNVVATSPSSLSKQPTTLYLYSAKQQKEALQTMFDKYIQKKGNAVPKGVNLVQTKQIVYTNAQW
jgi:hypothetical protein